MFSAFIWVMWYVQVINYSIEYLKLFNCLNTLGVHDIQKKPKVGSYNRALIIRYLVLIVLRWLLF